MKCPLILVLFLYFTPNTNAEDHYVRLLRDSKTENCLVLAQHTVKTFKGYKDPSAHALYVRNRPAQPSPADTPICTSGPTDTIFEIYGRSQSAVEAHTSLLCRSISEVAEALPEGAKAPEIIKIVDGGDPANRIDVVFMGDGYTAGERDEFFADIDRLTREMFEGTTFSSYLPLFNIWAVYVESAYSGIGYDGPEDTPFGLYREAGQLRGIYPGNEDYARTVCALTGPAACDYPSIIGNDDFYGGLGGEFVISTRSNRTGTVVLRHEMGHNFVAVGEEYDNGYAYYGVNSADRLETLGWTNWLSGEAQEERAVYRLLEYPWHDLSQGPVSYEFPSDGAYARWYLSVSVSAAGEADSLEFRLDGTILPWTSSGYDDREFYDWSGQSGFSAGLHSLTVSSRTSPTHPAIPRMIASIRLHEFGSEAEFHADNSYVSAYPTFSASGSKTFRPTNAGCLMRNMTHSGFCSVCKEGMWWQFLKRISLIDDLRIRAGVPISTVTLETLKLGQLREAAGGVPGEALQVSWYRNGVEQDGLRDQWEIRAEGGSWRVEVKFLTPEVRSDPDGLLVDSLLFTL